MMNTGKLKSQLKAGAIGGREYVKSYGSLEDVIRTIDLVASASSQSSVVVDASEVLITPYLIWTYLEQKVRYVPDPEFEQWVRSPGRLLLDGVGNCVDYTVFVSAVLRRQNENHYIRSCKYSQFGQYSHVYVVWNGVAIDPVVDFNKEPIYVDKIDFRVCRE